LKDRGPMPIGTARLDKSCFGCEDMASNGLEWTCYALDLLTQRELQPIDFGKKEPVSVACRGASYLDESPLLFEKMFAPRKRFEKDGTLNSPYEVSFRVVLPVPFKGASVDGKAIK